jgi:hypothetical protein
MQPPAPKLSEVKRILLELLVPIQIEYGYKINKSKFSLIKKEEAITASLQFTENHWFDEVQIIPSICVDIKEINEIWEKFDEYIGYSFRMNLKKIGYWYDNVLWDDFKVDDKSYYSIKNYDINIINASVDIQRLFEKYGLRYIQEYGSVDGVNKLMNSSPEKKATNTKEKPASKESAWWHCQSFKTQSIVGLIAAKLTDDGVSYKKIADLYTQRINQYKENDSMYEKDINRFFEIKKYLS